ncbi:MAG TPA: TIGR03619 family F420-dependent LLM class oxidoreductase [Acidimicrobiales bacterium]|nr:TIGR03619 family F420-dependent LLM class oxidoreductase [Acidimicrobiales bacterium]
MRLGITSFLTDRAMAPAALACAVEERGFHSLFLPEHTHLPVRADTPPALVEGVHLDDYRRSLDPLVALAAAASVTERIRLGTGVVLAAQHDPIVLAKQIATLDLLSNGRVVFGMGFGWNRDEAADHGVAFDVRREVAREHVLCMQALWTEEEAEFHGTYVSLDPCWSWPKPVQQPRVATLVGGGAHPSVFAAIAEYADGWMPIGGAGLATALPDLHRAVEGRGRDPQSILVVPFGTVPTDEKLAHFEAQGIKEVVLRVPSASADEMLAVLDGHAAYLDRFGDDG